MKIKQFIALMILVFTIGCHEDDESKKETCYCLPEIKITVYQKYLFEKGIMDDSDDCYCVLESELRPYQIEYLEEQGIIETKKIEIIKALENIGLNVSIEK